MEANLAGMGAVAGVARNIRRGFAEEDRQAALSVANRRCKLVTAHPE
jgi:hypothetical protein